jgi:hypothetical protein
MIMKKATFIYLISILIFLVHSITLAQIVYIPDQNFKNRLIIVLGVDTNGDGEISFSEAEAVTDTLSLQSAGINDLTGIEAFINIKGLDCSHNNLTELDISDIININLLKCNNNEITNIHINSSAYYIQTIELQHNLLKTIYFSTNTNYCNLSWNNISDLNIYYVSIGTLDISHNPILENQISIGSNVILNNLICQNIPAESINLSNMKELETVDIRNCNGLKSICVDYIPLRIEIIDGGLTSYVVYVCNPTQGNHFKAGQYQNTFVYKDDIIYNTNPNSYDLNEDGYMDILLFGDGEYIDPCYYGDTYAKPNNFSDFGININGNTDFHAGDGIYPIVNTWDSALFHVDSYEICNGSVVGSWVNESFLTVRMINSFDTIYSWASFEHITFIGTVIKSYALWRPCLDNPFLGNDTTLFLGDTVVINAGEGYDSYFWNTNDTAQSISIITNNLGVGTWPIIVYTNTGSCCYSDIKYITVVKESGVENYPGIPIKLFPNPAKDKLTITNPNCKVIKIELLDLNGKKQFSLTSSSELIDVDVSLYSDGIYFARITDDKGSWTRKIIKF